MVDTPKGILEDARRYLTLPAPTAGLVTNIGPLSLSADQTPDALNVFAYQSEMLFRGGFDQFSTLDHEADASFTYYDASDIRHMLIWSNGDIYDVDSGAPVLVAAGVYVPGEQIAHAQLNDVLYWATLTVPLRQYDGTTEQAVAGSGAVGSINPPACNFLVTYAGSLVAIAPVPSGVPQPSAFMWSNVNDPTTWLGASIQIVGSNDGSICTFGILMGIIPGSVSNPGVPATRQLLIGKTVRNLFLYQGALAPGSLTENAVPCPVGTIDPNSAVYIPTNEGLGAVMFLGSDGQFWLTNGSTAMIASKNIQTLAYTLTQNALFANPTQKFNAVYNDRFQYYMCDFGMNTQLVYKWDTGAWWLFQGWPSGSYLIATNDSGLPAIFVAAGEPATPGVFQIGLDQTTDNGQDITAYYYTPYLHGGQAGRQKWFQWFSLFTFDVGIQYRVTGFTMPRSDGTVETSDPLILNDPAFGAVTPAGGAGIWDTSEWDGAVWGGGFPTLTQPYALTSMHGRLQVQSPPTKWVPQAMPGPLKSGACQFKIEYVQGIPDFRVVGTSVGFIPRGQGFVGALPFETMGNVTTGGPDKFTNIGE